MEGLKVSLGWIYVFYPTTEVYKMPLSELITVVRECLELMNDKAFMMENAWLAESLLNDRVRIRPIRERFPDPVETTTPTRIATQFAGNASRYDPIKNTNGSADIRDISPAESQLRTSAIKSSSRSPTGQKSHETWRRELMAGLALLANPLPAKGEKKMSLSRRKL